MDVNIVAVCHKYACQTLRPGGGVERWGGEGESERWERGVCLTWLCLPGVWPGWLPSALSRHTRRSILPVNARRAQTLASALWVRLLLDQASTNTGSPAPVYSAAGSDVDVAVDAGADL